MVTTFTDADTSPAAGGIVATKTAPRKQPVRSEIAVMGMIPDGDYRLFSATVRCTAWTVGVEYDRHSLGHMFGAQMDYVAEALPFVLLSQPAVSDFWGNAVSSNQQLVHGLSLSPVGFRWLWRNNKGVEPYVVGKLGTAVFTRKAFSQNASYANFNVQAAFGLQIRLTERVDLRVEPFEFFHVSNGYLARSNPGMDELATRFGVSWRLG
ncbi:MAG: acyloxyacyl hydrolase, partial [Acidobacteriota bacterium]|nr:acyloxyacyl hydrolase [Acidobacteriota bacterium]